MSEIETMMQASASKFAQEVIAPKVRAMDEAEAMDPEIVERVFEQGLMGIEIPEEYGGSEMNFTAAIVGIEELAKVDPSVSVMVDVHNTLVNTTIMKYGTKETQSKWLPKLATNTVGQCFAAPTQTTQVWKKLTVGNPHVQAPSASPNPPRAPTPSR